MLNAAKSYLFKRVVVGSIILIGYFIYDSLWDGWIIEMLIGLMIFVFFFILLIDGLVFWITNRKHYYNAYLPFITLVIALVFSYWLPSHQQNKDRYLSTSRLPQSNKAANDNLYLEYYNVYLSGAFGSDVNSVYLTDSLNFRVFLGSYGGGERIDVDRKGDKVETRLLSWKYINPNWSEPQVIKQRVYSIENLKQRHIFD